MVESKAEKIRKLTERQKQIVEIVRQNPDLTVAEIGDKVFIAPSTAANDLTKIYRAYEVDGMKELLIELSGGRKEKIEASVAAQDTPQSPFMVVPPTPVQPQWTRILLVAIPIVIIALFFVFSGDGDEPIVTEVAQVVPTEAIAPTQAPTLIPTNTVALPTDTVGPTPSLTPTDTPAPTPTPKTQGLVVGDILISPDALLFIDLYTLMQGYSGSHWVLGVDFVFDNRGSSQKLLNLFSDNFSLTDNLGNSYPCEYQFPGEFELSRVVRPNQSFTIKLRCGWGMDIAPSVEYFTLATTNLSTLPNSTWIIEVSR